ncbi:MAG: glycosyltransferase family 4 protein [Clostridia bacterium]|nr:glycosyltransferase family 4 protein [Clostridia bacterium]
MKLLVSTAARLFKTPDGEYYTPVVYEYDFFKRYLNVFEEVIIAGFCDKISYEQAKSMLKISGERVSFYEFPYPHGEWEYVRKKLKIIRSLKNISKNCDAILLRVPETLSFLVMNRAIKEKIPFAIEVVSDPVNLYNRKFCASKYWFVYKIWYYIQLRRAAYYANGTSYVTEHELQKRYPPNLKNNENFTTFYTDTNIIIDDTIKQRKFPENKKIVFIHISTSIRVNAKGHKEALEAFARLVSDGVDSELVFVGADKLNQINENIIKENNLEKYVRFTGKLTPKQVFDELDKADVFLFPSYNEGLPRVVIEAMSRGLPVIATDIPAHRELLPAKYLSPVMESQKLYENIKKIAADSSFYESASKYCIEKAKEYDVKKIEKKRTEYYKKLYDLSLKKKNDNFK